MISACWAPVALPAHLWRRRAQLERFQRRTCPVHRADARCCCCAWAQPRCHCFSTKKRRALNLASWARACPSPAMPETLGKEAVCQTYGWNMLCSSHPRLAYGLPSTAASWALIYTGPENQGPLQSPWWSLLLCFTDFRYAVSQSFPFSLSGILSDRHRGISFTWLKKQSWVFCESKISASWLCRIFYIHGVRADVMQVCKVNKTSIPKATDTETALPSSRN